MADVPKLFHQWVKCLSHSPHSHGTVFPLWPFLPRRYASSVSGPRQSKWHSPIFLGSQSLHFSLLRGSIGARRLVFTKACSSAERSSLEGTFMLEQHSPPCYFTYTHSDPRERWDKKSHRGWGGGGPGSPWVRPICYSEISLHFLIIIVYIWIAI